MDAPPSIKNTPLPLFKSHYSFGKSILTLADLPKTGEEDPDGPVSVFQLAKSASMDKILLIEDSFAGFPEAQKVAAKNEIQLIFGLSFYLNSCSNGAVSKVCLIARNSDGMDELKRIYSAAHSKTDPSIDPSDLQNKDNLLVAFPFYGSFIARNLLNFETHIVSTSSIKHCVFLVEDNEHPFDVLIRPRVEEYCAANGHTIQQTKTILYEKREDFDAIVVFRIEAGESKSHGKPSTIDTPNLDHFASDAFCWESHVASV